MAAHNIYCLPDGARFCNGRYQVIRELGSGNYGITYLAQNTLLARKVAVKECFPREFVERDIERSQKVICIPDREEEFEKYKNKFLQEAQTLAKFRGGTGIVQVYNVEQDNQTWYMEMEYLEGSTLTDRLKKEGPFDAVQTMEKIKPILYALEMVHREGLVHRDIAPDNIMQLADGSMKLFDFGAAVVLAKGNLSSAIGKPLYSPLEQYDPQNPLNACSDIYALCATLYHVITGRMPDSAPSRVGRNNSTPMKRICEIRPEVPQAIDDIIFKGMQLRAEDRYQSAREMAEDIEKVLRTMRTKVAFEYYYDGIQDKRATEYLEGSCGEKIDKYPEKDRGRYTVQKIETLPLTLSENAANNIVRVYYRQEEKPAEYRIEYSYEGNEKKNRVIRNTANVGSVIKETPEQLDGYRVIVENSPLTVSADPEKNIIRVKYTLKGTVMFSTYRIEYCYDGVVRPNETTLVPEEVGKVINDLSFEKKEGYTLGKIENYPLTVKNNAASNVIRVNYVKAVQPTSYCIRRYFDGDVLTGDLPVYKKTYVGQVIDNLTFDENEGYTIDKVVNYPLTVAPNGDHNVIRVYYKSIKKPAQDTAQYTIITFYDGVEDGSARFSASAQVGKALDFKIPMPKSGYQLDKTENYPLTIQKDARMNIVRIYYKTELKKVAYTIRYYYDDVEAEGEKRSQYGYVGDVINTPVDGERKGYKFKRADNYPLTVSKDSSKNTARLYYESKKNERKEKKEKKRLNPLGVIALLIALIGIGIALWEMNDNKKIEERLNQGRPTQRQMQNIPNTVRW